VIVVQFVVIVGLLALSMVDRGVKPHQCCNCWLARLEYGRYHTQGEQANNYNIDVV
jgi:hypothetical protein